MSKVGKWLLMPFVTLVVVLALAITFTIGWRPFIGSRSRPLTSRTFERTPQRIARGRYIATSLSACVFCHSPHENSPGLPIPSGMEWAGSILPEEDLPGRIVASNLTPDLETGVGSWTDDQLARAIREGIGRDGRTLFPIMPYSHFRYMSDEDLASVVVYLRSLPPVRNALPKTEIIFPVKYLINGEPQPITAPVPEADTSNSVKRGKHLVMLGLCSDCHTPSSKGQVTPGMDFAGGNVLKGPWGSPAGANITPDATGIPYYDEALFLQVMRTGYVKSRPLNPIMPVSIFKNLTDSDLKDIFAYLKTVKPVRHSVDNSEPIGLCKLCKHNHGAGERN